LLNELEEAWQCDVDQWGR